MLEIVQQQMVDMVVGEVGAVVVFFPQVVGQIRTVLFPCGFQILLFRTPFLLKSFQIYAHLIFHHSGGQLHLHIGRHLFYLRQLFEHSPCLHHLAAANHEIDGIDSRYQVEFAQSCLFCHLDTPLGIVFGRVGIELHVFVEEMFQIVVLLFGGDVGIGFLLPCRYVLQFLFVVGLLVVYGFIEQLQVSLQIYCLGLQLYGKGHDDGQQKFQFTHMGS